jgi:hypothetical protein
MPSSNEKRVIVLLAAMDFDSIREGGCGNRDVADDVGGDRIDRYRCRNRFEKQLLLPLRSSSPPPPPPTLSIIIRAERTHHSTRRYIVQWVKTSKR